MYLMRFVYDRLLDWKNEGGHSTLEVGGARQVGKTYLIQKFADENYKHKIYINLFELSGKQFMECYKQATNWTPGTKRRAVSLLLSQVLPELSQFLHKSSFSHAP